MRRVSRQSCEDGPLLDSQETEGQRQLHSLLVQQLHTDVDLDRLVAKRRCFAPAALYRPFGEQASGVRSLSQFQALQHGDQELASLRELGLTDPEIHLWLNRDAPELTEKSHGVCAAPSARQQRLQVIRDKMAARSALLSRPQRFTASRALSRREMEIEQALFHGNDRLGFLSALYHRNQESEESQQGAPSASDPMDSVYREVFTEDGPPVSPPEGLENRLPCRTPAGQSEWSPCTTGSELSAPTEGSSGPNGAGRVPTLLSPSKIDISQPIGSLRAAGPPGAVLTVTGDVERLSEEHIRGNREPEEAVRAIPRFRSYQPGEPSKVLCVKNLSTQASLAQLVALFSRFETAGGPAVRYRLLTGRMKGQAFITLPDTETSQKALDLIHGYRLLGKPLVIEFGRERREEAGPQTGSTT